MKKAKVRERIYIDNEGLDEMELDILNRRHIERYALIRQWCYGLVLDVSCGCGYGTEMISRNPDVVRIIGVDKSPEAIEWANKHFCKKPYINLPTNTEFVCSSIEEFTEPANVLVSIETVEHLKNPIVLNELAERCEVETIFISYPSKKTTHYNKHHHNDFIDDDIIRIFKNYKVTDVIDLHREVRILKLEKYV
tara:strand:- start:17277 stop:17858 length:582 start_codon:yes stop_codon:yes gene_type:complete